MPGPIKRRGGVLPVEAPCPLTAVGHHPGLRPEVIDGAVRGSGRRSGSLCPAAGVIAVILGSSKLPWRNHRCWVSKSTVCHTGPPGRTSPSGRPVHGVYRAASPLSGSPGRGAWRQACGGLTPSGSTVRSSPSAAFTCSCVSPFAKRRLAPCKRASCNKAPCRHVPCLRASTASGRLVIALSRFARVRSAPRRLVPRRLQPRMSASRRTASSSRVKPRSASSR